MSKYNLTDLVESMGRGGTVNDSFYNIANLSAEIDGQNIGIDTYPIEVQRLGPSSDGKTHEEIVVRYGPGHYDYFSIYDYKFGEDPTEDNYMNDYPFSLGIPTKNRFGKQWAAKLGFNVEGMNEEKKDNIKEEAGFTEVSEKEIRFHLDAYKAGNISGDDLAQAIEEIVFGETRAPGTMEESEPLDEAINDGQIEKALADINAQPNEIAQYMASLKRAGDKFDSLDDYQEDFREYVANKGLEEHFKRFM